MLRRDRRGFEFRSALWQWGAVAGVMGWAAAAAGQSSVPPPSGGVAQRRVIVTADEVIVRDTPENMKKAEKLIEDNSRGLLRAAGAKKIEIGKWNIRPREAVRRDSEAARRYFDEVVEVIETMLYSQTGKEAARVEGRRLWADANLMTITLTDTRENIERVNDYIQSLEIQDQPQRSKVAHLKYSEPNELASQLDEVFGRAGATGPGGVSADKIWRATLRTGRSEASWGNDFRIRLVRVEENDADDDNDDTAEFVINTQVSSSNPTIEEFRSEFVTGALGEYEITVTDIRPSSGSDGSARVEARLRPPITRGAP